MLWELETAVPGSQGAVVVGTEMVILSPEIYATSLADLS